MSDKQIKLEEIIQKETDFVSTNNKYVYNIYDLKGCMLEFGKQLLELAAENATRDLSKHNMSYHFNVESILNTINQIK